MIIDLHCDTMTAIRNKGQSLRKNTCHFDIERARAAGLGLQIFALFIPPECENALNEFLKQMDFYHRELEENIDTLYPVLSYSDVKTGQPGKIGCILHLEGGEAVGRDVELLRVFYRLGLRSLGLTWNHRNMLADGVGEGTAGGGLSQAGRRVVEEMNRSGIILDLAHAGPRSYYDALELYQRPVLVSHANARAVCDHPRNLDDDQLRALAENQGVIGVNLVRDFVRPGAGSTADLLDHISYIADLIGVSHIGLGSDFDGADDIVMPGVERYAQWAELLASRGFSAQESALILRENALRVIKATLERER